MVNHVIVFDRQSAYRSKLNKRMLKYYKIRCEWSSTEHHQSNGVVESAIKKVKKMIRIIINKYNNNNNNNLNLILVRKWNEFLSIISGVINFSYKQSIGMSSNQYLFGGILDENEIIPQSENAYLNKYYNIIRDLRTELAKLNKMKYFDDMDRFYKCNKNLRLFKINDIVYLKNRNKEYNKLLGFFNGPFKIIGINRNNNDQIINFDIIDNNNRKFTATADQLKYYDDLIDNNECVNLLESDQPINDNEDNNNDDNISNDLNNNENSDGILSEDIDIDMNDSNDNNNNNDDEKVEVESIKGIGSFNDVTINEVDNNNDNNVISNELCPKDNNDNNNDLNRVNIDLSLEDNEVMAKPKKSRKRRLSELIDYDIPLPNAKKQKLFHFMVDTIIIRPDENHSFSFNINDKFYYFNYIV